MLVLSVLLFWIPVIGPLVAGFVGGRIARTSGKAFAASLMPAIVLGIVVAVVLAAFELPLIGTVAGIGVFIAVLVEDIPMIAGALIGAALTE